MNILSKYTFSFRWGPGGPKAFENNLDLLLRQLSLSSPAAKVVNVIEKDVSTYILSPGNLSDYASVCPCGEFEGHVGGRVGGSHAHHLLPHHPRQSPRSC